MSWISSVHFKNVCILFFVASVSTGLENTTCSNHCQLQDKNSTCWVKARSYFLQQLVKAVNEFASVEAMISMWQNHQGVQVGEQINITQSSFEEIIENNGGPLSEKDLFAIFELVNNKTRNLLSSQDTSSFSISCPTPCDYINTLWIYLFICSCIVVLLTIPIVSLHLYFSRQNNIKYQLSS